MRYWQEIVTLGITAGATVYAVLFFWRDWCGHFRKGCACCALRKYRAL